MGGGDLTREVTPWIWGGLGDEGALQEGVKVLGEGWETSSGRWRENGAASVTPPKPCQHLAPGHLWGAGWGWRGLR